MASFHAYKRRSIIPLAGLALAAYYFLVLVPLSRRANGLDIPLQSTWQKLAATIEQTNATAIDFLHITNQLAETRQAIALLENARQQAAARLELSPAVRKKMNDPFQLVDYQAERSKQLEETSKLAKECQVTLEQPVFAGFPEHTADIKQPAFLWAALSLVENLLATAMQCKVAVIHSLEVPLVLTNELSAPVTEVALQIELTGSADSLLKLLQNLPLRADEMRSAGLPQARPDKAPLFIERILMRKQSPDKLDEVRLSVRAVGFVLRE